MTLRTEAALKSGRREGPLAIMMEKKLCALVGKKSKKKNKTEVDFSKGQDSDSSCGYPPEPPVEPEPF